MVAVALIMESLRSPRSYRLDMVFVILLNRRGLPDRFFGADVVFGLLSTRHLLRGLFLESLWPPRFSSIGAGFKELLMEIKKHLRNRHGIRGTLHGLRGI